MLCAMSRLPAHLRFQKLHANHEIVQNMQLPELNLIHLHELYTFDDLVLVCSLVKGVSSVKHLLEIVHLLQIEIKS